MISRAGGRLLACPPARPDRAEHGPGCYLARSVTNFDPGAPSPVMLS
jgi:hypothetical protein